MLAVATLASALIWHGMAPEPSRGPVGMFTSLPLVWTESPDLSGLLSSDTTPHWARGVIEQRGKLVPLDSLASPSGLAALARLERLVIAQPRPLAPDENVALDAWVRKGGKVLVIVDPALTEDSAYAIGDPRRRQDVVMLSPILTRWGLTLEFDDVQPTGERAVEVLGVATPVNLPGRFAIAHSGSCRSWAEGVAVTCRVGKGRVVALADAAVLDRSDPSGQRARSFAGLLDTAFAVR